MSKVSEALEPWVYDPFYKGDDQPDQEPEPNGEGDCCNECDYWESQVDVNIENQIKESKLENNGKWMDPMGIEHDDNESGLESYI